MLGGNRTLGELVGSCTGGCLDLATMALWPPDVFAIAGAFLEATGAYRWIVDAGPAWPPHPSWHEDVEEEGAEWSEIVGAWCDAHFGVDPYAAPHPPALPNPLEFMQLRLHQSLASLAQDCAFVTAAVRALALADEACAGIGFPGGEQGMDVRAALLLPAGTCCSFPPDRIRVMPKARTPQSGMGLRSLSMNLALVSGEVQTAWKNLPSDLDLKEIQVLVLPWPTKVEDSDFTAVTARVTVDTKRFGFFAFNPKAEFPVELAVLRVEEAHKLCGGPELIVLPECALTRHELDHFRAELFRRYGSKSPAVLAGVRDSEAGHNCALLTWVLTNTSTWLEEVQHKHHRWNLDRAQIEAYRLGNQLRAGKRWWEAIQLHERTVRFFALSDAVVFCPLVCEDLARQEPVTQVVRAVGPTLVIALLLDGPQSTNRWPSRYATVLADDPGTSVLTVSALGMVERMHVPPYPAGSRNVALWKDCRSGAREITLEPNKDSILLTISVSWEEEWTADGRRDDNSAAILSLAHLRQLP